MLECCFVKGYENILTAKYRKLYRRESQRNANLTILRLPVCQQAVCVSFAHFAF